MAITKKELSVFCKLAFNMGISEEKTCQLISKRAGEYPRDRAITNSPEFNRLAQKISLFYTDIEQKSSSKRMFSDFSKIYAAYHKGKNAEQIRASFETDHSVQTEKERLAAERAATPLAGYECEKCDDIIRAMIENHQSLILPNNNGI